MNEKTAPVRRYCGAMEAHFRLLETFSDFRKNQNNLEQATRRMKTIDLKGKTPITIPVVVHVLYNNSDENISDEQIKSQIQVLNRDFQAKNPDKKKCPTCWKSTIGNPGLKFKLALKDPEGKKTKGITRTKTKMGSFNTDDSMKSTSSGGIDPWPTDRYLNIWVCTLSQGLLGYAQFPGGPPETDGVVILNTAFGTKGTATSPFNLGRTTTHEIGHWLNLRHIWADTENCSGSDFVEDTPNAAGPNYGKPKFPHVTCNNGPNGDMFINYMDYVDDDSMYIFTGGQVQRILVALSEERSSIGKS
jgi:hypothetical protein